MGASFVRVACAGGRTDELSRSDSFQRRKVPRCALVRVLSGRVWGRRFFTLFSAPVG